MFAVLKQIDGKEHGINQDGTTTPDLDDTELYDHYTAKRVATEHGGIVVSDERLWPQDFCDDEEFC
jgi:hypothetical protein